VDATNAKASLENGVLTITLPKLEQTKRQSIKVEQRSDGYVPSTVVISKPGSAASAGFFRRDSIPH
jgi:hypothetical protein